MFSQSRFADLLQAIPKTPFYNSIEQHKSDRYAKSFKSWDLLVLMLYGQIKKVDSLRTLVTGFNAHESHHYHLNTQAVRRSTVSDALASRSPEPYKALCESLMSVISRQQRKSCKELLCIIDSTIITLRGDHYDEWTLENRTRQTQGLKVHVAIDAQQNAPTYANITPVNINDVTDVKNLSIEAGMTYVIDKGYCDYNWWHHIESKQAKFVTRLKYNANYIVVRNLLSNPKKDTSILSDEVIQLPRKNLSKGRKNAYANKDLRLITVHRAGNKKAMVIVTNDFDRSAEEIAALYKQRWQIELLFKWLKQKLKLKKYFGYSENATLIQIYCALIAYLLMVIFKQQKNALASLSDIAIELRHNLFKRERIERYYYQKQRERKAALKEVQGELWGF
ncbi:MAG: IS4 family transposase [Gammaproteobacteria bacterium]|nr:IS4 family transposase [Gammaproteobacteria bacterium]